MKGLDVFWGLGRVVAGSLFLCGGCLTANYMSAPAEGDAILKNVGCVYRAVRSYEAIAGEIDSTNRYPVVAWPGADSRFWGYEENSTGYLRWLMTEVLVLWEEWGDGAIPFLLPEVPSENDPKKWGDTNNAWCVIAGLQFSTDDSMPFMFTRNIDITTRELRDRDCTGPLRMFSNITPFGAQEAIIMNKGGAVRILRGRDLSWEVFRPVKGGLEKLEVWYPDGKR